MRLTFQEEFSDIYIYNLKGNARTQGERRRREGGGIFAEGARTGITIAVFVKRQDYEGAARIHYAEVDDYLSRQEKLDEITAKRSIAGTDFMLLSPNEHGDWISQRDESFTVFQPIGDKETKGKGSTPALFYTYSAGLKTNRDAWCYNFSSVALESNMARMIEAYNAEVRDGHTSVSASTEVTRISWNRQLFKDLDAGKTHYFIASAVRGTMYRPFTRQAVYFERSMNDMVYQLPQMFPTAEHFNLAITVSTDYRKDWSCLLADRLFDLTFTATSQGFPLYTWEKLPDNESGALSLFDVAPETEDAATSSSGGSQRFDFDRPIGEQVPLLLGGYRRRDNITDATLEAYRAHYADTLHPEGEQISKEDIFFYVYALLHHPTYRERYEADLRKMLPRIPMVPGFWEYANNGRELAELHVNYEHIEAYPLEEIWSADAPVDEWSRCRVEKLKWAKGDSSRLVYNEYLTFAGIPEQINDYTIGGRSPLEWMIDRYKVTVDKKSQILNDPNEYFREVGNPRYLVDLIKSLVTVTMRTIELTKALPEFIIEEDGK